MAIPRQAGLARHHWTSAGQHELHLHRASHVNRAGALQGAHIDEAAHAFAMADASTEEDAPPNTHDEARLRTAGNDEPSASRDSEEDDDDEDEDEPDEEPKLKYSRLTASLGPVYRNGDATSTFMVAGDKMVGRLLPRP
jgi:hypothetical protein